MRTCSFTKIYIIKPQLARNPLKPEGLKVHICQTGGVCVDSTTPSRVLKSVYWVSVFHRLVLLWANHISRASKKHQCIQKQRIGLGRPRHGQERSWKDFTQTSTGRLLLDVRAPIIPATQEDAIMHKVGKFSKFSSSLG